MDFVYNCCLSAKMNLLDFFEKWGFLTPVNKKIEDYDTRILTVTPDMVDALRHKVNEMCIRDRPEGKQLPSDRILWRIPYTFVTKSIRD